MNVLLVGYHLIGDKDATGQTLLHIHSGTKNVNYLQYCLDYDESYHSTEFPVVYADKEYNKFFFNIKSRYRSTGNTTGTPIFETTKGRTGLKGALKEAAIAFLDGIKHKVSPDASRTIEIFHPDVIYTLGSTIASFDVAYRLSQKYNIPIVIHIMDDWIATKYGKTFVTYYYRKKLIKLMNKANSRSVINLAISDIMAKSYSETYKKEYRTAMNCIDELHLFPYKKNQPLKMIFSGGLHGGRAQSLKSIEEQLAIINSDGKKAELYIYTSPAEAKRYKNQFTADTKIFEYVPKSQMFDNLSSGDILIHVESFEPEYVQYFKYSMSTKIPEYLSVGRPIFCYGDSGICTVKYLLEHNAGIIATEKGQLPQKLRLIIENENEREKVAEGASILAGKHLTENVAATVTNAFSETISRWN